MTTPNTISALEEALRIFWLENANDKDLNLSENDLKLMFTSTSFQMSDAKRVEMIDRLFKSVNSASLGQIITEKINFENISESVLINDSKLPVAIWEELKADLVYPNNIPVVILSKLLKFLNVSFQTAEQALLKTFEILKKKDLLKLKPETTGLAFRRASANSDSKINRDKGAGGRDLFENEESLKKYLVKLKELMSE